MDGQTRADWIGGRSFTRVAFIWVAFDNLLLKKMMMMMQSTNLEHCTGILWSILYNDDRF